MKSRLEGVPLPVLSIGRGHVVWLPAEPGEHPRSASFAHAEGVDPVAACLAAVKELVPSGEACLVALGTGWIESRTLELPPLPRREFARVLQRKAATLLGTELDGTLFAALPLFRTEDAAEAGTAAQPWLVLAMRRAEVVPLLLGLRRAGLRARRVVSARLASLAAASSRAVDAHGSVLAVSVEPKAVTLGLLHQGTLRFQSAMEGSLADQPALAMSLLQEVKSTEAWWRKHSRGGKIDEIVLLGASGPRGDLLRGALRNALGEVRIAEAVGTDGTEEQLAELLAAARIEGPLQLDLSTRLPWRRRDSLLVSSLSAAAVLVAGLFVYERLDDERQRLARETEAFAQEARELERYKSENAAIESALSERLRELTEVGAMSTEGCDMEALLTASLQAFEGRADLLRIAVEREGTEHVLELRGETDPHPARAMAVVLGVAADLRARSFARDVIAQPEDLAQLGRKDSLEKASGFLVRATLREDS
jgi:hypothetical protein